MQQQMSLLETSLVPGMAPVWTALDEAQRVEVVTALARLIAKVVSARSGARVADPGKTGDE